MAKPLLDLSCSDVNFFLYLELYLKFVSKSIERIIENIVHFCKVYFFLKPLIKNVLLDIFSVAQKNIK